MRHLSRDPSLVRTWAEARDARPAMTDDGQLVLVLPERELGTTTRLSWEEFAGHFTAERLAFVYDLVPGSDSWIIGPIEEIRPFAEEALPVGVP